MRRELDSRTSGGIEVRLLWNPGDGHVSVAVIDTKGSETIELAVRDGDRALDVFQHRYAYVAWRHERTGAPPMVCDLAA